MGACNLATANDALTMRVRRWEEGALWLWGCSASVCEKVQDWSRDLTSNESRGLLLSEWSGGREGGCGVQK